MEIDVKNNFQRYFQKIRRFIVRIRENMWWTRWNENFLIFWLIWGNIISIFIRSQNLTKLIRIPTCNFNPERTILRCIPKSVYRYIMNLWKLRYFLVKTKKKEIILPIGNCGTAYFIQCWNYLPTYLKTEYKVICKYCVT